MNEVYNFLSIKTFSKNLIRMVFNEDDDKNYPHSKTIEIIINLSFDD